ncbi:MAG: hypothetical protein F6J93_07920 [Oscillatoria sp. SIO1A7]|nr:hypothetical protein [Oscillatoria sp. SIO1A7]
MLLYPELPQDSEGRLFLSGAASAITAYIANRERSKGGHASICYNCPSHDCFFGLGDRYPSYL